MAFIGGEHARDDLASVIDCNMYLWILSLWHCPGSIKLFIEQFREPELPSRSLPRTTEASSGCMSSDSLSRNGPSSSLDQCSLGSRVREPTVRHVTECRVGFVPRADRG
jgi:hypothetical protein